ncbi:MAG TPA: hypothetical protein VF322_07285 [Gammaproteobacteria bacterium]
MTNRRTFLQIGLAASAWPIASRAARTAGVGAGPDTVPLYKVVYDTRFPESVAFARRAEALGVATAAIDGDMTRLWYDDLCHRWRAGPAAIAGLTAHGALFCLERLAWDQRMRVVFRAEHRSGDACVAHDLTGPAEMLPPRGRLEAAGAAWAERMADVVARCPSGRAEIVRAAAATPGATLPAAADALYSWVIAPIANA